MLNLYSKLDRYLSTYENRLIEEMKSPRNMDHTQSMLHTDFINKCSKGDLTARRYVVTKLSEILKSVITEKDTKEITKIIEEEYAVFNSGAYQKYKSCDIYEEESLISYYQCVDKFATSSQLKSLKQGLNAIDCLSDIIYKRNFGLDILDDLLFMNLNNIEVHGTRKIRIEGSDGVWYTIKNFRFTDDELIRNVATKLVNQDGMSDITDSDCEKEGKLFNGARLMIALQPASLENNIFIKKFDSFNPSEKELLQNGTVSKEMLEDIKRLTKGRANVVIIGGVNVGKSTFTKVYMGLYPKHFKIGMLDSSKDMDMREMYPDRDIITLYETEKYSLNDQFSRLLRANRNILGISEARSFEIEQMIKGMTRGNSGSFCTLHATNSKLVVDNIAYMCLESGVQQDLGVLRNRISNAIDIVIRLRYDETTGLRLVDEITEIVATGNLNNPFEVNHLYYYDNKLKKVVRNYKYTISADLDDKLRYYGCTDADIDYLNRNEGTEC